MTAQGEDILAYLDRAISQYEETARAASESDKWTTRSTCWKPENSPSTGAWVSDEFDGIVVFGDGHPSEAQSIHIALHDPESVLRRCAADRKLINLHQPDGWTCKVCANEEQADENSEGEYHWSRPGLAFPCPTIEALAEGYGWTEGER